VFSFCGIRFLLLKLETFRVLLKILEAFKSGVAAFQQQKSDGLTADRIDSTMLDMEEVKATISRSTPLRYSETVFTTHVVNRCE